MPRKLLESSFIIKCSSVAEGLSTIEEEMGGELKCTDVAKDNNCIKAKTGNRFLIRLFGTAIIYDIFKKPLPAVITAQVLNSHQIQIVLQDNLGPFCFIDPICSSSYKKFFGSIGEHFRNKVKGGSLDYARDDKP